MTMSRYGALLKTYCDEGRKRIYLSALMETKQEISKEGWRALGKDREAVKKDVVRRFETSALPHMKELVHGTDEWFLYPVYRLPPEGKWFTGRVMLLGDSAHVVRLLHSPKSRPRGTDVSPSDASKGESIGYALEDAIVFSCVISHFGLTTPRKISSHFMRSDDSLSTTRTKMRE